MKSGASGSFGAQLKALREKAGFTQDELATIAGLSVHAVSALERGERRRPHVDTVRALSAALDLNPAARDALLGSARALDHETGAGKDGGVPLPVPPTILLGRDADVKTLRQWLADQATRMISIVGPGGVGKTRLALEVARTVAADDKTRVLFVPLAAVRNSAFVAPAIAEALGLPDVAAADLPKHARAACAGRPTLLVLDNFEQVLEAATLVADLLAASTSLRMLTTSRAALRVRGEQEYVLGPLALDMGSEQLAPADLARSPAVRLFMERVRSVQPGFRLTSANGPTVTAICRRLDALPLALELAAPWMKVLTIEDLFRRLASDALWSTAGLRDLPERQQTMNATVAWSYQLLEPNEQRAFRRLGAVPGRFSIEVAADVLAGGDDASRQNATIDEALNAAAGLIDKSLLLRAESSTVTRPLYQMLETVRAYAALELNAAGEREEAMEGLVRYCTAEASRAAVALVGPDQPEWLDRVRSDLENYRGVLTWLIEHGRLDETSLILWNLRFYWMIRGRAAEALGWLQHVLSNRSLPPSVEARALAAAAQMWWAQGAVDTARTAVDRALELVDDTSNLDVVAYAEHLAGHFERAAGNLTLARDLFVRSLGRFQTLSLHWGTGNAFNSMASIAFATGDTVEGERLLDEATSVLQQAGPWFSMPVLYVRAIQAVRRGHADTAIALLRQNLNLIQELNDKFAFVYALVPLAAAAALQGDDAWAARVLGARDAVIERTGLSVVDTPVQDLREQAERQARARLGPDRWAKAYTAGRNVSIDSARDLYRFVVERGR
jgi:predicted ATPase/DNA-binding XRE family transcriptional regulator